MPKGAPKTKPVEVGKKIRQSFPWFEDGCAKAKEAALKQKRALLQQSGRRLKSEELQATLNELERIQRELNPLEERHEELSGMLLAHWAHTEVEELKSLLGVTLIAPSFKVSLSPDTAQAELSPTQWQSATERRLNPQRLLALADREHDLRAPVLKAVRVSATVKVTPPSSRRPRSGQPENGEEE
ncbi:hypothetical protein HY442_00060 [Candidatus Parcubacteria bacterium]|nr:hypothetical protein [Candidatus Parcubacteria bacterium]MBI4098909.1 hypothetical protein [Candidatus Parcubacteria bacterium]